MKTETRARLARLTAAVVILYGFGSPAGASTRSTGGKAAAPPVLGASALPQAGGSAARRAAFDESVRALGSSLVEIGQRLQAAAGAESSASLGAEAQTALNGERLIEPSGETDVAAAVEIPSDPKELRALVKERSAFLERFNEIFGQRVIGQQEMRDSLAISILTGGNLLLQANPGLAKTRSAEVVGRMLDLDIRRIQGVPDTMPADITGQEERDRSTGDWKVRRGPALEADMLHVDEVNRMKTATQSALLQVMQEKTVALAGENHAARPLFFVIATQNPIEQEGTNPLPEAQKDRFLMQVNVDQPSEEELVKIAELKLAERGKLEVPRLLTRAQTHELRRIVSRVIVERSILAYAAKLVKTLDPRHADAPAFVKDHLREPVGPRGIEALVQAAQGQAFLQRRHHVIPDDIKAVAHRVLRHRVILQFKHDVPEKRERVIAKALDALLAHVPAPAVDEAALAALGAD